MSFFNLRRGRDERGERFTVAVNATESYCGNRTAFDRNSKHVRELEKEGAEVREVNYGDRNSLEHALRDVDWLVHLPESSRNAVRDAEELSRAAREKDVRGAIALSLLGADEERTKTHRDYHKIEKIIQDEVQNSSVLRVSWMSEAFLLWSENIREKCELDLNLDEKNDTIVPVDFEDFICAICALIRREFDDRIHHHNVYSITGRDALNPRDIVDIINETTNDRDKRRVRYRQVKRNDIREYLRNLDEDEDRGRERHRNEYDPRCFLPLNDREIEKILDILEYAKESDNAGRVTDDFRRLTGDEPRSVEDFFKNNRRDFEPRGDRRRSYARL
ncbi:9768_t:CDS:2 [Ambispora leptoticha]|uniref:9768_t:CDS:1 n=1 Tax=Ambispora leptoticha TaxID=144679 RepID=A0A9N9ATU5_9GLOM|nr:9768_t:CDS:2 [Ambispora leptoticha]